MARRLSINVHANHLEQSERFFQVFAKVKPDAALIMDNPRFALRFYNECLNKGGTLFYRTWDVLDSDYHLKVSPQKAIDDLSRELQAWELSLGTTLRDKFTFIYRYNEPAKGDIRIALRWIIDFMKLAAAREIKVSAFEWAVAKSMNQSEIAAGLWDEYLRESYRLRAYVKQTTHDYTSGPAWLDVSGANLLDFDALRRAEGLYKRLDAYLAAASYEAPLYHIGREIGLYMKRAKELSLPAFDWYWTECFIDQMTDIPNWQQAKDSFKVDGYDAMRGIFGHFRYYERLLGRSLSYNDFADFIFSQWTWLDKVMPPNCRAMMAFAASTGTQWDKPAGCNLWDARIRERLWERIADYHDAQSSTPVPNPVPPVVDTPITPIAQAKKAFAHLRSTLSSTTINVRSQPLIAKETLIGQLANLEALVEVDALGRIVTYKRGGFEWCRIFDAYAPDSFVAMYKLDALGNRTSQTFAAVELLDELPLFSKIAVTAPSIEVSKDELSQIKSELNYLISEGSVYPKYLELMKWLRSQLR